MSLLARMTQKGQPQILLNGLPCQRRTSLTFLQHCSRKRRRSEMGSVPTDLAPPVSQTPPRTILFQRKRANRRILNEPQFLDVLREFGEVTGTHKRMMVIVQMDCAKIGLNTATRPA